MENGNRRRVELIARRELVGHTHESLAEKIEASVSAISSWERGRRTPRGRLRRELALALGVNLAKLDHLLDPAAPPQLDGHQVQAWLTHYESLVHAAGAVRHVEKALVPGLFQTEGYANVIERYGPIRLTDEEIIRRVDLRIARQSVLDRKPEPLQLTVLMAETVLYEIVGSPEIMTDQLDHLDRLARRPNIELRLIPADGRSAGALGGFELLIRPDETAPFLAVSFEVDGSRYVEHPEVLNIFNASYDYLASVSLSPPDSIRTIRTIKERYQ